ncbi:hypothetical protein ACFQU2_33255 [Siccirubricoccus deserti]
MIAAANAASHRLGRPPATVLQSGREALARVAAPGEAPHHLVCDPPAAGPSWPHLLDVLRDPSARTRLLVVSSAPWAMPADVVALPADPLQLAAALLAPRTHAPVLPAAAAAALEAGMARGEIAVRFQPVVRIADRQPVMVEALARWHPPHSPLAPMSSCHWPSAPGWHGPCRSPSPPAPGRSWRRCGEAWASAFR